MKNEQLWLLLLSLISTVLALLLVVSNLHWFRLGWAFKDRPWMKARWSKEEIICMLVFTTIFIAARPVHLLKATRLQGRFETEDDLPYAICWTVLSMAVSMSLLGAVLLGCARVWLQFFNSMVAVKIGLAEWRSMIDESLITEDMSWFLRHKQTWGNRTFINKFTIVLLSGIAMINLCIHVGLKFPSTSATVVIGLMSCIFCFIIAMMYPAFQDEIHLRKERLIVTFAILISMLGWIIVVFAPRIMDLNWKKNYQAMLIASFIRQMYIGCCVTAVAYCYFPFVISHFEQPTKQVSIFGLRLFLDFDRSSNGRNNSIPRLRRATSSEMSTSSPGSNSTDSVSTVLPLSEVLASNDWFGLFMQHLFAEFSYENALCLIECVKFREKMCELYYSDADEDDQSERAPNTNNNNENEDDTTLPAAITSRKTYFMRSPSSSIASLSLSRKNDSNRNQLKSRYSGQNCGGVIPRLCSHIRSTKSTIVSELKNKSDLLKVAGKLRDKYISQGSSYCVNLSHYARVDLIRTIDDAYDKIESDSFIGDIEMELSKMIRVDLFDDVIRHCVSLLKDSFSGFVFSDACVRHLSMRKSSNRSLSQHNRH